MPFDVRAFKKLFFDARAVRDPVERAALAGLARFGAFVRRGDKSSLKYRPGGHAAPGDPPHVHRSKGFTRPKRDRKTGAVSRQPASPLRELTFFGVDRSRKSVVIGPAVFGSKVGGGRVPRVVEEGGVGTFVTPEGGRKVGHFHPHPHTLPAFRKVLPMVPQMFRDALRGRGV